MLKKIVKKKPLDFAAIILSFVSVIIAVISLVHSYKMSNIEMDRIQAELEPSLVIELNENKDSLSFQLLENNVLLQSGNIVFPPDISREFFSWGYYEKKISINEINILCEKYLNDNYKFEKLDSFFYVGSYPFPMIVHYEAIINGKPISFRGFYYFYFDFTINKNSIKVYPQYLHKFWSLPIPLKRHVFIKNPFKGKVPLEKIMKVDSVDVIELLNHNLKSIKNNRKFKKFEK